MKQLSLKYVIILLFTLCVCGHTFGQYKWHNPFDCEYPVTQNQGWQEELSKTYLRLPERAQNNIRTEVWNLSRNSAGLAIHFYSNAPEIQIRYKVKGWLSMPHMPATGVSGVDMYRIDKDGNADFCAGQFSFADTIRYTFRNLTTQNLKKGDEYRIFLPLYNETEWLEIGVGDEYELTFIPSSLEKPIVLYGTSIAHGACASRPGMAWGNILNRKLEYPLINLGFSGNGRLEKEVLDLISEIDARLYIIDCLPNLGDKNHDELKQLITNAVKQLRTTSTSPILLVEHIGYSNYHTDSTREEYKRCNKASQDAYATLLSEGMPELYYITCDELAIPKDGWVDHIHPSDLGMQAQADAIEKKAREILQIPIGSTSTTIPATQRREPEIYEWHERHQTILNINKTDPPKAVIFGNSIVHYWGGEPKAPIANAPESWNAEMSPRGFRNMGYGFDRIENLLWRVYHGELDRFSAETVVVAIGTNNIGINTPEEIIEGIDFLLDAIKTRQPQARLIVSGILPRKNNETLVKSLNKDIHKTAKQKGWEYIDPGIKLLQPNGKINESLFLDGLHPNETGYKILTNDL